MAMVVTLQRGGSQWLKRIPDPSGGTFDAAGDFDDLLGSTDLAVLGGIDPYEDTTFTSQKMAALIVDVDSALVHSPAGPQTRGLRRLRVMAEMCQSDEALTLHFFGD